MEFLTAFGLVAAGAIALYGIFDKRKRDRDKEVQDQEDKLRNLYKEEIQTLTCRIDEQEKKGAVMDKQVQKVTIENKLLRDLVIGQDSVSKDFREKGLTAMQIVSKTHEAVIQSNENSKLIMQSLEKLYLAIEKHLAVLQSEYGKDSPASGSSKL